MKTPHLLSLLVAFAIASCTAPEGTAAAPATAQVAEEAALGKVVGGVLPALLSGKYSAARNPGNVTRDEAAAILASGNNPAVIQLVTEYDFTPFVAAGVFSGATPPRGIFEAGGWDSLSNFGWQSNRAWPVPASLSARRVVFNNLAASWGEHGPKWGVRAYNVVGVLSDIELWRVGDWSNGREGHSVYLNVAGDLDVSRLRAVQCGGQMLQIVWRVGETQMPRAEWPTSANLISINECTAQDCGAITAGQAVRASWPVSIFATGARVEVHNLTVNARLPEFIGDRGEVFRAHGALLVSGGEEGRRTPELTVDGLAGSVTRCDRSEIRLAEVDTANLSNISLVEQGGDGVCTIDVVDDCHQVHVSASPVPVTVRIIAASKPFSAPYKTVSVPAGTEFTWP